MADAGLAVHALLQRPTGTRLQAAVEDLRRLHFQTARSDPSGVAVLRSRRFGFIVLPERMGSASGVVNVGGFVASLLTILAIGAVLDVLTPGSSTDYDLGAHSLDLPGSDKKSAAPVDAGDSTSGAPLSTAGLEHDIEARVIIQHGQRMALVGSGLEVPHEVDLPEVVRVRVLETVVSWRLHLFVVVEDAAIVTLEDRVDSAVMGRINSRSLQQASQLASAPVGVAMMQLHHRLLQRRIAAPWAAQGTSGAVLHTDIALLAVPIQPLVARPGTDAIPPTELPHITLRLPCQQNELTLYRHSAALRPRHHSISRFDEVRKPKCVTYVSQHPLPMSPG